LECVPAEFDDEEPVRDDEAGCDDDLPLGELRAMVVVPPALAPVEGVRCAVEELLGVPAALVIAANAGPAVLPNTTTPAVSAARLALIDRRVTRGRRFGRGFNLDCAAMPSPVSVRPCPNLDAANEREHVSQSSHHAL
jgi:hypothetical protein